VRTLVNGGRVLVTGATGLIGTHVLRVLPVGAEMVAVSRTPRRDGGGRVRWRVCDLTQPGSAADLVASVRPDIVIHLAGAVRGDRSLEAVGPTLHANLVATVELLEAATRASCHRIVLSGSQLEEPAAGGHDAIPPSPYGASRWASSAYGRMFQAVFGTPVVILRPQYVYGPGQRTTFLIPHVISALLDGRNPQLSAGERMLDCVYAEDVAHAYVAAADAPGVEGDTIDIGSGSQTSVRRIVELIVEYVGAGTGRPIFGALPQRPLEQFVQTDVDETARVLGWRATTGLEEGLRRTVDWYRAQLS